MTRHRPIKRGDGYVETRRRASGTAYRARWFDGTRWRSRTFATEDDAYDHLRETGRRMRRGQGGATPDITVAELLTDYIDRGQHRWSSNTVATYTLLATRQIGPWLGATRIAALSAVDVQRWLDRRTGAVSASVLQTSRTLLSGACREAVRLGMLDTNPVIGTQAPALTRTTRTVWSADDIRAVLATVADDVTMRTYYLVALTTGMRPGELRALMWEDVDLERGLITVQRTMTRDADFRARVGDTTKTHRTRAIAIPAVTVDALRSCRDDQDRRRASALAWAPRPVVLDRGDGNPLAQQTVSNRHRAICDRAGVPRIRQHDLRHTAARAMVEQGTHMKVIADILGHGSVTTTMDIYASTDVSMQREAIDRMTRAFSPGRNPGGNDTDGTGE